MDPITQQTVLAAAGAAGGDPVYVDDVFSTFLYDGNGGTQTITNGIDLAGEGGLVWTKGRDGYVSHYLYDTERGQENYISSDSTAIQGTGPGLTSFNSNGFGLGTAIGVNGSGSTYASWTFRKAPGFFDVVTYTGSGSAQSISHSLGSVPGMILIKCTSNTSDWSVYHRSMSATKNMHLNTTAAADTQTGVFNDTEPTATNFTVNYDGDVNGSGKTYVAYIFAHDDASFGTDGDESIIKCGSYTGNGGSQDIDVGFEPQWFFIKRTTGTGRWMCWDEMRGSADNGLDQPSLYFHDVDAEAAWQRLYTHQSGFGIDNQGGSDVNSSSETYIYMAIRRPHKPPEVGTDVFAINTKAASIPNYISGFPVDFAITRDGVSQNNDNLVASRLQGQKFLKTNASDAEINSGVAATFDHMNGFASNTGSANSDNYAWMFKRAPGFMDVVAYTGTGANQAVNHNLTVTPEFVIIKQRSSGSLTDWICWHKDLTSTNPYIFLNASGGEGSYGATWITPSSTALNLSSSSYHNASSQTYIAYLFATLPGISKVGSYTGTGNAINVDCGFTGGARFVLIKNTDTSGNWMLWDTLRGIVSGNEPFIKINTSNQQESQDYISPLSTGFTINASSHSTGVNNSGDTYIFLAIA